MEKVAIPNQCLLHNLYVYVYFIVPSAKFAIIRKRPAGTGRETSTSQDQYGRDL